MKTNYTLGKSSFLEITEKLKEKYKNNKACSLSQVKDENPDIKFTLFNSWTNQYYGMTAKVYLIEHEIIERPKEKSEKEKRAEAKQGLYKVMHILDQRYCGNKANSFSQVMAENTDLPISSINAWSRLLFDMSAKQYLIDQGIIISAEEKQLSSDENNTINVSTIASNEDKENEIILQKDNAIIQRTKNKLRMLTNLLIEKYGDAPAEGLIQIKCECGIPELGKLGLWTDMVYGISAKEYLIKQGVIAKTAVKDDDEKKLYVLYELDPGKNGDLDIDSLGFSIRTSRCLKRVGVSTLNELLQFSMNDLNQIYGFGMSCKNEIHNTLDLIRRTDESPPQKCVEMCTKESVDRDKNEINDSEKLYILFNIEYEHYSDVDISSLGFANRTINCLKRANILTLEDLVLHSMSQIEEIRGFGVSCRAEILNFLFNINSAEASSSEKFNNKHVKIILKENAIEVFNGNFACEAFSDLENAELEYIKKYKEAYDELGENITQLFNSDIQQIIKIIQILSIIRSDIKKQTENEQIVKQFFDTVSKHKKSIPLKSFIEGYAYANGSNVFINKLIAVDGGLPLGESKKAIIKSISKLDYPFVEKFFKWCIYDYEMSLNELMNEIKAKEKWAAVIEGRSCGQTLEEVGKQLNLTRERVRQIEKSIKKYFVAWNMKNALLYHIFSDRDGDKVLTTTEIESYLGDYCNVILYLLKGTSELYDADLDVFLIGESIRLDETQIYIDNLPDILTEEQFQMVTNHGISRKQLDGELLDKLLKQEYTLYGKIYSRKKLSLGALYQEVLKRHFHEGMHIYEKDELERFRQIIKKEYGREISANDRALSGRISGIGVLAGRGIYKAKKDKYIPENLRDRIYKYIVENPLPMLPTSGIYNYFEDELVANGIDNRYYLHGILGELFDDEFSFKRDYVCKDETATSMYEEIVAFIEQHEYPVSKNEIIEHFPGVTSIVVLLATEDEKILNLFGEYIHVNRLKIYDDDVQYLKTITEVVLQDGDSHHVKVIYEKILNDNKSLLERLNLGQAFALFSLLQYLFGNDFGMSRPYLAKKGKVIGRIPEQINEIFANSEDVVLNDVLDFAKDNHYVIYSIIDFILEHTDTHILANKELMISVEKSGLTEAYFKQVEELIYNEVEETTPIANLRCIHEFEKIDIPWNEWVVFTATYKWTSRLEVSTIGNQFRAAIPVISRKGEMDVESLQGISNTGTFVVADDLDNIDELLLEDLEFEFGELD